MKTPPYSLTALPFVAISIADLRAAGLDHLFGALEGAVDELVELPGDADRFTYSEGVIERVAHQRAG